MAVLLSDAELQSYSNFATGFVLKDTATVYRRPEDEGTGTPDGQGGFTGPSSSSSAGWDTVYTGPCAIIEALVTKGGEMYAEGQLQSKSLKTALFPRGTDVRDSDRVKVVSVINSVQFTTFYEVSMMADPSTFEVLRRAYVLRVGQGAN